MSFKRILSLDGGGSHLLIQLGVLACLEEDTGTSTYDLFDMMAGSSSGGLITVLILGKSLSAHDIIHAILKEEMMDKMMLSHWTNCLIHTLQMRPKYNGASKRAVLQDKLGNLRLSSLSKRLFIPAFNLDKDQLDIFSNDSQTDFLLSEIADACTAAPTYYPPVKMEDGDWRVDGGVGMNNPGLSAYLHAKQLWHKSDIKLLSIGSGWRSFSVNGARAIKYGGIQWSSKGIASLILREKMIANVKMTEEILRSRTLYINDFLKNYDMPDNMDSANNTVFQKKALNIGELWYAAHRMEIKKWLKSIPMD